jgi:transformation/transcription domain-associated protein
VEHLLALVFKTEKQIMIEPGSILRAPLRKFLQKFPTETIQLLFIERNMNEDQIYRFVKVWIYFLKLSQSIY